MNYKGIEMYREALSYKSVNKNGHKIEFHVDTDPDKKIVKWVEIFHSNNICRRNLMWKFSKFL